MNQAIKELRERELFPKGSAVVIGGSGGIGKVICETLDTYGNDGWEVCSMLVVAGSQICCFLKRRTDVDEPKVDKE